MVADGSPTYLAQLTTTTGLTPRPLAARGVGALAAAAIPLLLLLPYASATGFSSTTYEPSTQTATGWQTLNGSDIAMTICSVAVVVLVGLDLFVAPGRWLGPALAVALVELGLAWPDLLSLPISWAAGAYIVLLVGIAECVALVIAYRGPAARGRASWPGQARCDPTPSLSDQSASSRSPAGT